MKEKNLFFLDCLRKRRGPDYFRIANFILRRAKLQQITFFFARSVLHSVLSGWKFEGFIGKGARGKKMLQMEKGSEKIFIFYIHSIFWKEVKCRQQSSNNFVVAKKKCVKNGKKIESSFFFIMATRWLYFNVVFVWLTGWHECTTLRGVTVIGAKARILNFVEENANIFPHFWLHTHVTSWKLCSFVVSMSAFFSLSFAVEH